MTTELYSDHCQTLPTCLVLICVYCRGGAPLGRPPPDQGQVQTLRQNFPVQGRLQFFTGTHLQHLRSSRQLFVAKLPYLALRLLRRHQKIRHFHCLPNFCMSGSQDSWITIYNMLKDAQTIMPHVAAGRDGLHRRGGHLLLLVRPRLPLLPRLPGGAQVDISHDDNSHVSRVTCHVSRGAAGRTWCAGWGCTPG